MTATPRQLSDAIQADYDEILASRHAADVRAIERWELVGKIAKGFLAGAVIGLCAIALLSLLTGSLLGWLAFVLLFAVGPFIVLPLAAVWVVAATTKRSLKRKLTATVFTLYGITVDHSITPPVYSVAGMSPSLMNPALHRSWKLLTGANLTAADEQ